MKIAMGNDHSAIELKNIIKEFVESKGYEVIDLGTNSTESCDYCYLRYRCRYLFSSKQGKRHPCLRMQRAIYCKAFQNA